MKKPNIEEQYLIHDLRDDSMWGAYPSLAIAKKEVKKYVKYHQCTIDDFSIEREILIQDRVWSGSDETN